MTLEVDLNKVIYTGNGTTTIFPFSFVVLATSDLKIYLHTIATGEEALLSSSAYSVSGIPGIGSVTYAPNGIPMASTHKLIIVREVSYYQSMDIENQGGFYPDVLEEQLDRIVMQTQQLAEEVNRSIKVGYTETNPAPTGLTLLADAEAAQAAAEAAQTAAEAARTAAEAAYTNFIAAAPATATVLYQATPVVGTTLTLSESVDHLGQINVYRNAVLQRKDGSDYTVSGTTLTVTSAFTGAEEVYVERTGTFGLPATPSGFYPSSAEILDAASGDSPVARLMRLTDVQEYIDLAVTFKSIKMFGAVGDGKDGSDGAITATDTTFIDTAAAFVSADVGKLIRIDGAGTAGAAHVTTIASITSATEIELTAAAVTTVSGVKYVYGTNDTDAIDAAFSWVESGSRLYYNTADQRDIIAIGNDRGLRWNGGYYLYNGTGYQPVSAAGRTICIRGDGVSNSIIEICSDIYLIDYAASGGAAANSIYVDHIKVCGGKGLYINRATTAVPQCFQGFDHVTILNHSEYAIFSYWGDSPRWWFTNGYIESVQPNAKGIYLPKGVANPCLSNTTIVGCRYRIVTADAQVASSFISGLTSFSLSGDGHEADIWLIPAAAAGQTQGTGTIITGNRFSNENRGGKPVVLIARPDGIGNLHEQNHSTTPGAYTFRDMLFTENIVTGVGTADTTAVGTTGPMIRSYATDLGRMKIKRNSINVAFTHLLYLETDVTSGYASDLIIGPNDWQGTGDRPLPCNKQVGIWLSDDGEEIPSLSTPQSSSGGYDVNYTLLSLSGSDPVDGNELTLGGSATRSVVTDALGGANAYEYTYTTADATDYVGIPVAGIGFTAGGNCYLDIDIKNGATLSLTEVDIVITITTAVGSETIRRSIIPTADWLAIRIPFSNHAAMTGLTVRIYPSTDSFSAGVRTKIQLGRPHVYRANRPVNRDHVYIANGAWNAGRIVVTGAEAGQVVHIWPDWTNSLLRFKFGSAPTSETDGTSFT